MDITLRIEMTFENLNKQLVAQLPNLGTGSHSSTLTLSNLSTRKTISFRASNYKIMCK